MSVMSKLNSLEIKNEIREASSVSKILGSLYETPEGKYLPIAHFLLAKDTACLLILSFKLHHLMIIFLLDLILFTCYWSGILIEERMLGAIRLPVQFLGNIQFLPLHVIRFRAIN